MELADPRLITQLTEAFSEGQKQPRKAKRPRMTRNLPVEIYQPPRKNRRRCQCGVCPGCRENARWDRIFAEKFADPNYYAGLSVRYASPIHTNT